MLVGIQEELLRFHSLRLLKELLIDKTTKGNIIWATDAYVENGEQFASGREIQTTLITGDYSGIIKNRARRHLEQQAERTKRHAEVFTPLWVCNRMNNYLDEAWLNGISESSELKYESWDVERIPTSHWKQYIDSKRLEITCGEAPFLVQRYEVATGEVLPIEMRQGILDRKLKVVGRFSQDEKEWVDWAIRAFQATYAYEYQGDSLLIARVNLLITFEEYLYAYVRRKPTRAEYLKIINVIVWNVMQMDGLTYRIPCHKSDVILMDNLFGDDEDIRSNDEKRYPFVKIHNWREKNSIDFNAVNRGGKRGMKFDFIIGNPPYQDEVIGENKTFAPPIYNLFMDETYKIGRHVELIHPARFLFNAGSTPKAWNRKMLEDPHFSILAYEPISATFFAGTDIKGGVAISYRDVSKKLGPIGTFSAFNEIRNILRKVINNDFVSLEDIVFPRVKFRISEKLHEDYPEAINCLSKGHAYDMSTNIFELLPFVFFDEKPNDGDEYIQIYGRHRGERVYKWIKRIYVKNDTNLETYKIILPKSNGSGALGEVLSTPMIGTPMIGTPMIGTTETFITIGKFFTEEEVKAALKYIKSKFARTMLGVLKVTQDNPPEKWKYVPIQDFSDKSDIDWNQSVEGIDRQLYKKYGLDDKEIEFIETHVKEME